MGVVVFAPPRVEGDSEQRSILVEPLELDAATSAHASGAGGAVDGAGASAGGGRGSTFDQLYSYRGSWLQVCCFLTIVNFIWCALTTLLFLLPLLLRPSPPSFAPTPLPPLLLNSLCWLLSLWLGRSCTAQ